MISPLVYLHIRKRSKKLGHPIPHNYRKILRCYAEIDTQSNNRIIFSWLSDAGSNILNATSMIPGAIILNAEWAATIVLENSDETKNAFWVTVGHELTHKDSEINWLKYPMHDFRFIAQLNEVHADFGAAQKMCHFSRQALLQSIDYKIDHKSRTGQPDTGDNFHPSWARRRYYVANFDFDKELIQVIANDLDYRNQKMIEYAAHFYDEIKLL